MSEKKEQAIYDAIHEVITRLRVQLLKVQTPTTMEKLDTVIAQAGHAAGMAAIAAYRQPLRTRKVTP